MPYICLNCFKTFKENLMKKLIPSIYNESNQWLDCPDTKCCGEVIEVDELMLPIIKVLNKKGYYTKYCCSGHAYDNVPNCYIFFDEGIELPNIPKGFSLENNIGENSYTIRKFFNNKELKAFKEINKTANQLLDWANKLPKLIN